MNTLPPTPLDPYLLDLPLGSLRYYESVGSTNDLALAWAEEGAPDFSLVAADAQTSGRGRLQRRWVTHPGAALAFSVIFKPSEAEISTITRFSPYGALALVEALQTCCGLASEIKWPNDVLVRRHKVAGILVESSWVGSALNALVLGIGVNVSPAAVPPADQLLFPATSVAGETGSPVDRWELMREILAGLGRWRSKLRTGEFIQAWEGHLAFRGEWVRVAGTGSSSVSGQLIGVDPSGSLRLRSAAGQELLVEAGDVHLRPTETG